MILTRISSVPVDQSRRRDRVAAVRLIDFGFTDWTEGIPPTPLTPPSVRRAPVPPRPGLFCAAAKRRHYQRGK